MAKKDKLIKSKSIYTIKKLHSRTNDSVIFENDHVTIVPNDGIYNEDMTLFSESNFKYRVNTTQNNKKRHNRGEFIKNGDDDVWTLDKIGSATTKSEETKIILKPNYTSLKDFAYYGSAVELIKATINDVVLHFPGGIYYYGPNAPKIGGKYLISNEFNIDCWTGGGAIASGSVKNPMRVLAASFMNYTLADGETECPQPTYTYISDCPNSIIGKVSIGSVSLSVYMDSDGKKYLLSDSPGTAGGIIIQPKQEFVDKFWDEVDDFTRVLLNRDSTPLYKAVFETPYSDDTGFYYQNKSYIWPTVGTTNIPDITTAAFQGYLEGLISLATFHDEYDSDNIWRMMTHESIKNLDWTFTSKRNTEENDLTEFDTNGIGAMIRIYGRQFDDIKRYADNIKNTNTITYDEKSNIPDYFLTDIVENDGWEAQHTTQFDGKPISGAAYVNSVFQRRLALSSDYIQSMKGTRRGIEAILGMFGYKMVENTTTTAGEFNISEFVYKTTSGLSYSDAYRLRAYFDNPYEDEDMPHKMYGYPVTPVITSDSIYLIPWFHKELSNKNFYFQSRGGWGKMGQKTINLPSLTTATTIKSTTIPIYQETQPYMRFANNISEMLSISHTEVYENMICYVTDISNIDIEYQKKDGETIDKESHYFCLKNTALSSHCGFLNNELYNCYGWKYVPMDDIKKVVHEGAIVVYLESLKADYKGNNPHVGYGKYDDGQDYLDHYRTIFKDEIADGRFKHLEHSNDEREKKDFETVGVFGFKDIAEVLDNKKCAFFKDYEDEDLNGDVMSGWNSSSYTDVKFPDTPVVSNNLADESQANGIINIKKLIINFGINGSEEMRTYIQNVVMKYLEQMVPSTTLLQYSFDGSIAPQIGDTLMAYGSFDKIETAHAMVDNNAATIWGEHPTPISEM